MILTTPHEPAWAGFWDDRCAVGLKILLLLACILASALLEAPR